MYLVAYDSNLVVSIAYQIKNSGKVVARVYYDRISRSYEDCVRFGALRDFSSLQSFIDYYLSSYDKVIISRHS